MTPPPKLPPLIWTYPDGARQLRCGAPYRPVPSYLPRAQLFGGLVAKTGKKIDNPNQKLPKLDICDKCLVWAIHFRFGTKSALFSAFFPRSCCHEVTYHEFGDSTLLFILGECAEKSASKRKESQREKIHTSQRGPLRQLGYL